MRLAVRLAGAATATAVILAMLAALCAPAVRAQTGATQTGTQAATPNISGNWIDAHLATSQITIFDNGGDFSFRASAVVDEGPLVGVGFESHGAGRIVGNSLDLNFTAVFRTKLTVIGHCSGILRKPDVIAWRCRDNNAFESKPVWLRQ